MRFYTDGLLSKWGFGDGDMLDDLLWDAVDRGDLPLRPHPHRVLVECVRRFVLPAIKQTLDVYEIITIHNPIRSRAVDGVEIDEYDVWWGESRLTPEWVDVPLSDVLEVARAFTQEPQP